MYMRILILCCVLLVALTQTGCIGLIINTPGDCVRETPYTGVHDLFWSKKSPPARTSTKEEFLIDWGKPDEIINDSENKETWVYNRKLWCGWIPVIILPIPLILPVCDGFDKITFKGSVATRLYTRGLAQDGFMAVFFGGAGGRVGDDSACRFPWRYISDEDSDTEKPAEQVTP
jgi:hypothetical protein